MSPHEWAQYRKEFEEAAKKFGWTKCSSERSHERDWGCSWKEEVWLSPDGKWMIDESDMSEELVKELIRISKFLPETYCADS